MIVAHLFILILYSVYLFINSQTPAVLSQTVIITQRKMTQFDHKCIMWDTVFTSLHWYFFPHRHLWIHTIKAVWSRPTSYCLSWRPGRTCVLEDLWGTSNSASPVKIKTSCWPITGQDNPSATNRTFSKDRLIEPGGRWHGQQPWTLGGLWSG